MARTIVVVEGCGQWAMQYLSALKALKTDGLGVFFTYDSTFGLDQYSERLRAETYLEYLQATLKNVKVIQKAGFACLDVKDTLHRLQGAGESPGRRWLPQSVNAVFVVTPDRTHCTVARYWLGRAQRIFVEKPFATDAGQIDELDQALQMKPGTEIFGIDHYFVRCNQAAIDHDYFMKRLRARSGSSDACGHLTSFKFEMTEPPECNGGKYDAKKIQERVLSLQAGMVFDMGAHAFPILTPFIDFSQPFEVMGVHAGISKPLRQVLFSGAESYARAEVKAFTKVHRREQPAPITGTLLVGKDVGERSAKYLQLEGPGGRIRFDLVNYHAYHENEDGRVEPVAALQQDWVRFFVNEVLEGRVPKAVEEFRLGGARRFVGLLEDWRGKCQGRRSLRTYEPGATAFALETDDYRVA